MFNRAFVFGSLVLTAIVVLITLGLFSYSSSLESPGIAEVGTVPSGTIDLALSFDRPYLTPLQENTLTLTINASSNATAATVELQYDSSVLEIISVQQGSFFTNTLSSPTFDNGVINFTYAAAPDSGGVTGTGTLATITIKPLRTLTAFSLEFTPNTLAAAVEYETNTLRSLATPSLTSRLRSDLNTDSTVNLFDYNLFVDDYGYSQDPYAGPADLNESGEVDLFDYNLFVDDYGQTI